MAKKNYIKLEFDNPGYLIGVASNEKIWKVCWEINQVFGINLSADSPEFSGTKESYSDRDTEDGFEYFLLENPKKDKKVPRIAREFRFWFIIKPDTDNIPDLKEFQSKLNRIPVISLAVDLSDKKDINKLIP